MPILVPEKNKAILVNFYEFNNWYIFLLLSVSIKVFKTFLNFQINLSVYYCSTNSKQKELKRRK